MPRNHLVGRLAARWSVALSIAAGLAACGGGGGGGASSPPLVAAAELKAGTEAVANAPTVFDISASAGGKGGIVGHSWDYGDGQSGSDDTHLYAAPGHYNATLTVTDGAGTSASKSVAVTVSKCSSVGTQAATLSPYKTVCVQTNLGEMVFELYDHSDEAPNTAANFLAYVDEGFYTGTLFHRVIANFVIQGGGFTAGPVAKTPNFAPIALENHNALKNWQYTLAMARTGVADSATSQFFVNLVDNHNLDYDATQSQPNGYAVFGLVISGTGVADAIGNVATGTVNTAAGPMADVPTADVTIRSIVRMP